MKNKSHILQRILDNAIDNKKVFGTSFCLKYKGESWCGASGNLNTESQYFIASTTKLFVTAIIFNFQSRGVLSIEDKISKYLNENVMAGLHVFNGHDFSNEITIKNLLAHTSGIPDYFQQKDKTGSSLVGRIAKGIDESWTFEQTIEYSKSLKPLFRPDAKNKAHYSDTNFQLLGRIIENITHKSISENYDELIIEPLGLKQTYLFKDVQDSRPKTLYYKNREIMIPKAMASFGPDGGIVSTSTEMLKFIEAFFNGAFFPVSDLKSMKVWNKLFIPLQAGVGIQRFRLPWFFNPLGTIPDLIGHSGLSGAIAYHSPEKDLYIAGTVNQVAHPDTSFRLAIKLIQKILTK